MSAAARVAEARLIADGGAAAWAPDFFRSRELCVAEGVTHTLEVAVEDVPLLLAPLVVNEVAGTDLHDGTSPYGFPGGTLAAEPVAASAVDWSGAGLVSLFLRDRVGPSSLLGGTVRNHVHVVDPATPVRLREAHRRHVARNQRDGFATTVAAGSDAPDSDREAFTTLYREAMARAGAAERYAFSDYYFATVLRSPAATLLVTRDGEARPAAAAIVVRSDGMLHYYLGGTSGELLSRSPLKTTIAAMIELAGELGLPLNLGGGLTPGDSLDHFKQGFANSSSPFHTHEIVAHPPAYERLSAGREGGAFFPAYRAP